MTSPSHAHIFEVFDALINANGKPFALEAREIHELTGNTSNCFGEESADDYVRRLVDFLHNDYEEVVPQTPRRRKRPLATPAGAVTINLVGVSPLTYTVCPVNAMAALKNRWKLCILYKQSLQEKHIAGSCLLHFNDIYKVCEVHEVCVSPRFQGKGICKLLMQEVKQHLLLNERQKGLRELRIYCESDNGAACRCYHAIFGEAAGGIVLTPSNEKVTGFVLPLDNVRNVANSLRPSLIRSRNRA